jgi:hypothetical protein
MIRSCLKKIDELILEGLKKFSSKIPMSACFDCLEARLDLKKSDNFFRTKALCSRCIFRPSSPLKKTSEDAVSRSLEASRCIMASLQIPEI